MSSDVKYFVFLLKGIPINIFHEHVNSKIICWQIKDYRIKLSKISKKITKPAIKILWLDII